MSASTFFPLQHRADTLSAHLQKRVQVRGKRGRGKAVSWPPEDQICQIRFFLSNDLPSSIGSVQNTLHLNRLKSPQTHSRGVGVVHAPPGFHGSIVKRPRVTVDTEAFMLVGRSWLHPGKFVLDSEWLVADGSESKEADLQHQRELRVLEAFYPRLTSIPDSPAEPAETCMVLLDSAIPSVPMEEEDDECGKETEDESKSVGIVRELDEPSEHGKLTKETRDFPSPKVSLTPSQDPSWQAPDSSLGKVDSAVAAAAAAAMAFQKCGASGLVDPHLLVEILRNPALLKSLTYNNQPAKRPAVAMSGHEVCTAGRSSLNSQPTLCYDGPLSKACTGLPLNAGLPSPVSVLSDWTQDYAKSISTMHSKPSENINMPNLPIVSCALSPSSAPLKCQSTPYMTRKDALPLESAPVHGLHAWTHEARIGYNASCTEGASAQTASLVHVDRSCGTMAPLAPFPAQNALNFDPNIMSGTMQSVQSLPSFSGATHHQGFPMLDNSTPCRTLPSEAWLKSTESCGSSTKGGQRTTRLCMYFNTPRGCRNGQYCAFLHQSGSPELNAIAQ